MTNRPPPEPIPPETWRAVAILVGLQLAFAAVVWTVIAWGSG